MNIKHLHTIAIFFASALLFASHAHSSVLALCVGDDGHVEVEILFDGNCATDLDQHSSGASDSTALNAPHEGQAHCGSCTDIPIGLGHTDSCSSLVQVSKTNHKVPVAKTILSFINVHESQPICCRNKPQPDILSVTITCLRTVSLLI